jgi:hypothetical protein
MSFSSNFTGAFVGQDPASGGQALFVEGHTSGPNQATAILALLRHDGQLLSQPANDASLTDWTATFPQTGAPFPLDDVVLTGVALVPGSDAPLLWQSVVKIEAKPR